MNNDFQNSIEYEEWQRQKAERRRKKRMIIIRRRIMVGIIALVLLIGIITLMVKGIIGIVHRFSKQEDEVVEIVAETECYTPSPSPTPTPEKMLADAEGNSDGPAYIHGKEVFSGYSVDTTSSKFINNDEQMMSTYAALIDASTGKLIASKSACERMYPASMTKILTALVAAEHITEENLDDEVEITSDDIYYVYKHDLSAVGYQAGDMVTVKELFYGTILQSGADSAMALARYVAGSEEEFVKLMNDKLAQLGLSSTSHFTNCVGTYADDHYSTCVDMAMILKATIENDFCYEVLFAHTYDVKFPAEESGVKTLSNWFLRRIEDKETHGEVLCAKTGYVNQAGSCAASYYISNEGIPYFCVTAQAHSAWRCIYDQVYIYDNEIDHQ